MNSVWLSSMLPGPNKSHLFLGLLQHLLNLKEKRERKERKGKRENGARRVEGKGKERTGEETEGDRSGGKYTMERENQAEHLHLCSRSLRWQLMYSHKQRSQTRKRGRHKRPALVNYFCKWGPTSWMLCNLPKQHHHLGFKPLNTGAGAGTTQYSYLNSSLHVLSSKCGASFKCTWSSRLVLLCLLSFFL